MRCGIRLLAILAAGLGLMGCTSGSRVPAGQWDGMAHGDLLAKAGLRYYWNARVPLEFGEAIKEIHRLDENLYCLTTLNKLIAVDATTGVIKWSYQAASPSATVFPPVHADNVRLTPKVSGISQVLTPPDLSNVPVFDAVMFNTDSYLVVLNRATGEEVRGVGTIPFMGYVANAGGSTDGTRYFVGSPDGQFEAVRLQEGLRVWTMSASINKSPVVVPVLYYSGRVYVAVGDGEVCVAPAGKDAEARVADWIQKLDAAISGGMYVDSRGCFVPCWDHRLYAFEPATGARLWEPFICDGPLLAAVQVGENSIFQFAEQDKLYALDVATGKLRWKNPAGRLVLSISGGKAFIKDARDNLMIVDEMTGQQVTSLPLVGHEKFVGNTSSAPIYTAKADGRIFCIAPLSLNYLSAEMLHPAKPRKALATLPASRPAAPTTAVASQPE